MQLDRAGSINCTLGLDQTSIDKCSWIEPARSNCTLGLGQTSIDKFSWIEPARSNCTYRSIIIIIFIIMTIIVIILIFILIILKEFSVVFFWGGAPWDLQVTSARDPCIPPLPVNPGQPPPSPYCEPHAQTGQAEKKRAEEREARGKRKARRPARPTIKQRQVRTPLTGRRVRPRAVRTQKRHGRCTLP